MTPVHAARLLRPLLLGACAFAPSVASAAPDWTSAQRINEVVVDDSFTTLIIPPINNPMVCGVPSHLRVHKDDSNYASMTAAILSAQAQGKNVRLFAAACYGDSTSVSRVSGYNSDGLTEGMVAQCALLSQDFSPSKSGTNYLARVAMRGASVAKGK
jgi:hypothetical protein